MTDQSSTTKSSMPATTSYQHFSGSLARIPKGSVAAIITPMSADGAIAWQDLEALIEWHVQSGSSGLVVAGTTGECATLSIDEQSYLFQRACEFAGGRIPIIAGTGSNCTDEAVELSKAALAAGACASLSVVPYYNRPSQEGMYRHFLAQADAAAIPLILYNVPARTSCDLQNKTILRLTEHPNVIGIKDATGDLLRAAQLMSDLAAEGQEFLLYSGEDISSLGFMRLGGHGAISVTANVAPALMSKMCRLALSGDFAAADQIDRELRFWHKNLFIESSPAPTKYALWRLGKIQSPDLRLPLVRLSEPCQRVLDQELPQ